MSELSYYQRNKERLKAAAREYHYKHREHYREYSRKYYQDHKAEINLKRAGYNALHKPPQRQRAHLTKANEDPQLEQRRKIYEEVKTITLSPIEPPKTPIWSPKPEDFTVRFD